MALNLWLFCSLLSYFEGWEYQCNHGLISHPSMKGDNPMEPLQLQSHARDNFERARDKWEDGGTVRERHQREYHTSLKALLPGQSKILQEQQKWWIRKTVSSWLYRVLLDIILLLRPFSTMSAVIMPMDQPGAGIFHLEWKSMRKF